MQVQAKLFRESFLFRAQIVLMTPLLESNYQDVRHVAAKDIPA